MIIDAQLLFSDSQAITATAASTNSLDFGAAMNNGIGQPLYIVVVVDEAFTDSGSDSECAVSLEFDSTTTFTPDLSVNLFAFSSGDAVGTTFIASYSPLSTSSSVDFRYLQLKYTVSGGSFSTGKVTAFLTSNIQAWKPYAKAYTIS